MKQAGTRNVFFLNWPYLDFSIKNAGFIFAVGKCDFSVFAYNFYSFNKHIVVKLGFVQRTKKMHENTAFSFPTWLFLSWKKI